MAIPTPKTPTKRGGNFTSSQASKATEKLSSKQPIQITKKNISSVSLSSTKKLPTPPSRELFHQERKAKKQGGNGILSTLISLCIVGLICFLGWTNRVTIINYLESMGLRGDDILQQVDEKTLFVGKEISLTGIITPGGKSGYYTHTLKNDMYGLLGIRSKSLNLKNFSGNLQLGGQVSDFVNGTYIIDINSVTPLDVAKVETGTYIAGIQYISEAGLIVGDMKSDGLQLAEGGVSNPNIITITNSITNANLIMRYFACDESVSQNCKRFAASFDKSVGIDFVDSFGNVFYKLADGNTRFVSLDDRIGIYIETKDPSMIPLVIKNIQFVTTSWAKKTFDSTASSICASPELSLRSTDLISLISYDGGVAVQVSGLSNKDTQTNCLIDIDPKNSLGGKLISIKEINPIKEETPDTSDVPSVPSGSTGTTTAPSTPSPSIPSTPLATNGTKQFALKPGKEITFTSRGNTITFPSPSIAYSSSTPLETIAGLKCSIATKVINYVSKENLSTSPDIILYGCASGIPKLDTSMRSFSAKGMTYIVKINNPAWVDFANAIKVE